MFRETQPEGISSRQLSPRVARSGLSGHLCFGFIIGILLLPSVSILPVRAQPFFMGLGDLPGGDFDSLARKVSADGLVVVGSSNSASGYEAFRWTSGGGMVGLGDLPEGTFGSRDD